MCRRLILITISAALTVLPQSSFASDAAGPRKVVVGTSIYSVSRFSGQDKRTADVEGLIDQMARQAAERYPEQGLDLVVLTEEILTLGSGRTPPERALRLNGSQMRRIRSKARQHETYVVVPLTLAEEDGETYTNAAVLLDRNGKTAGIYRKVHPVAPYRSDVLEGGITPGTTFPIFQCDFGKVGIQICWDMSYEDGWRTFADQGAEIVAIPTASPQSLRPASNALAGDYYVVTSTPRDNASVFNPIGRVAAQIKRPGVLVHQIDLSYARLHWSPTLHNGRAFTERYGDKAGYEYDPSEDTGLFWSNDPQIPIAQMIAELGEVRMTEHVERVRRLQDAARPAAEFVTAANVPVAATDAENQILLLVRSDDMGVAHGINEACLRSVTDGIARSIEVIVPGPWFAEAAQMLRQHPQIDVGVHLDLTSEWSNVKWGPISQHVPSLTNAEGYFYSTTAQREGYPPHTGFLECGWKIGEVERELRAQIEMALEQLPKVTHLSAHMGTATSAPELKALVTHLAKEYRLPLVIPELKRAPRFGGKEMTPQQKESSLVEIIEGLRPGLWMIIEHPGQDTPEMRAIGHLGYENVAADRAGVTHAFTSERVKQVIRRRGIQLVSYSDVLEMNRSNR